MKQLIMSINGNEVLFSTNDCTSSADFYVKSYDLVYKAFDTNKELCEKDHDLYMTVLSTMTDVLSYFLSN